MVIWLIVIQIFAAVIFANHLLLEKKYCGHLSWWSNTMAWLTFALCLIPGLGILLAMAGCVDCARNVAEELSKRRWNILEE